MPARSSYQRVYVAKFCEQCGKEEFEGEVFGQFRTRRLRAQTDTRQILCDRCSGGPKPFKMPLLNASYYIAAGVEVPEGAPTN